MDPSADYGCLNSVARHRINTKLIAEHWDDLHRLLGSLKLGVIQATSVMRTLQIADRPTKLLVESGIGVSAVYVTCSVQVGLWHFAGYSPLPRPSSCE